MRKPIIAGNWKMNCTVAETEKLISDLLAGEFDTSRAEVVVCPPFTALGTAARLLDGSPVRLGGQNMSEHKSGAYTGEVSAEMLLTVGAAFVILGHSERRQYHAESDRLVSAKARRALDSGLIPIICVGETLEQRERGETESVVDGQVAGTLAELTTEDLVKTVIAYEPVWAIGTGRTATPEMAQEVHRFIRERLSERDTSAAEQVRILYGGSVNADNAADLLAQDDIDGALVGGASLKADGFIAIINSV
ncbi:MAG: triose-phosphate isomerase [Candidatus Zixiibacteriota bacterium]|nr:MAG: triose-phosphate isomerase [candidate division Zixibacteria bacterium]